MTTKISKKLLLVILFISTFLPFYNAGTADASSFFLDEIALPVVENFFAYSLSIMFTIVGKLLAMTVAMLGWVVNLRIYTNVPVITEGWKIMRDFANMLFIIALIVMAYGTIFNIKGYDFRSLIPKFLIAALLINFSLVIGGLIIDGTQILNNTFLLAMGDISGRLGQGLNPVDLFPKVSDISSAQAISNLVAGSIVNLLFATFLLFTFVISTAVPLTVALVRIPILWALLIVAPLAWLLSILPATRGAYNNWWKHFLAWNLFLPYYLFFMYFALYFLNKKDEILRGLGQDFVYSNLTGLQSNFTFGLVFYYVMVAIFLIGGTKVAMSAGRFSGTGIVSVAKWGRGVAMRRLGVTAAQRAAEQKIAEVQKEGLPGRFGMLYGGERALEEQTARWASRFGVRGADIKVQQAFIDRAGKEYGDLETKYRLGQVNVDEIKRIANSGSATNARVYAYRKMLAKTGQIDANISQKTFGELGNNALAMEDFAKTASSAKWSSMIGANVRAVAKGSTFTDATGTYNYSSLRSTSGTAARREAIKHVQDDKLSITDVRPGSVFDVTELKEYVDLTGGPTTYDAKELIKSIGKFRPDLVYDLATNPRYASLNPRTLPRAGFIKSAVDMADYETIAFMPRTLWTDPDFQAALLEKYNRRTSPVDKDRFKAAVLDEIAKTPDSPAKTAVVNRLLP